MKKVLSIFLLCSSALCFAQDPDPKVVEGAGSSTGINTWELGFGIGVEQYREQYIEEASIRGDERLVVIEKTTDTRPSGWLTINWNIFGKGSWLEDASGNVLRNTTYGLFAGVKIIGSDDSNFSAFSLGPQVSFELQNKRTVSVGLGWVTHPTKTLARGINEGEALPEEFDDIVYKEGTENSYMLMLSVGL